MRLYLTKIKEFILNLIFPQECLGCEKEGNYLCQDCLDRIALNRNFYCALCKQKSEFGLICPACKSRTALRAIWVSADYNNQFLQELIHALKYKYLESISGNLAQLAVKYLGQTDIFKRFEINQNNTIFVPVPLHRKRFLTRGFNQSNLIAEEISKLLGFKNINLLKRLKNTETQTHLKRVERQDNVKEAFGINDLPVDKTKKVILVDDVVTTGSTLKECAQVLADSGFQEIYGLVIAQRED